MVVVVVKVSIFLYKPTIFTQKFCIYGTKDVHMEKNWGIRRLCGLKNTAAEMPYQFMHAQMLM